MASTYGNDLRLEEIGDGEQSGTWGATTNTNLELIAEALSYGTEAITTNADTHTTTIADGATDPGRSLYLKYTGTLDSTCTITIAPNSISKTWYIENGTSGSQSIIISQGSGANVTIPTGQTKIVYSDGAGSGAAMAEIGTLGVTNLNVSTAATVATLDTSGAVNLNLVTDSTSSTSGALIVDGGVGIAKKLFVGTDLDVDGTANLDAVDIDGAVQLDATLTVGANDQGYDVKLFGDTASAYLLWDTSADKLLTAGGATIDIVKDKLLIGGAAVTSTAAEINTLDALSRGSILYGNASAATTVLTKGAADTVLTSDGTDISWAAAGGGGGEQTFTAGASLTAGNLVGIGQAGTLLAYVADKGAVQDLEFGNSGATEFLQNAYDTSANALVYIVTTNSNQVNICSATLSGFTITQGTPEANLTDGRYQQAIIYDATQNKSVIKYADGSNNLIHRVCTLSGTSLTSGSAATTWTGTYSYMVNAGASKVLTVYRRTSDGHLCCKVGTISGTSISFGSEVVILAADAGAAPNGGAVYEPDSGKMVVAYIDSANSNYFTAKVGTISGTSISFGTAYTNSSLTIATSTQHAKMACFANTNLDTVVFTVNSTAANANVGMSVMVGTVSGTDISFGALNTLIDSDGLFISSTFNTSNNTGLLNYGVVNDGSGVISVLSFSGTTSTLIKAIGGVGNSGVNDAETLVYDPDQNRVVQTYRYGNTYVVNADAPAFAGIAAENISSGATGTVTVAGGINTSMSNLAVGASYGVASGAATLSVGGGTIVGSALSATSLYLSRGTLE